MNYYPRNILFWQYHIFGLLALMLAQGALMLSSSHVLFQLASNFLLWPIFFTHAALLFRWWLKGAFKHLGVGRLIPVVVVYSAVSALVVSASVLLILMPFFMGEFIPGDKVGGGDVSYFEVLKPMVISATLFTQLIIAAWIFIYVFVGASRRAKENELHNLKLQNALKEARISNLASQLNPHFLFNAMNNIRFMIYESPKSADHMITTLSEILRYSLVAGERETVPFSEELNTTQRYISIVKMQYESKLECVVHVDEAADNILVPPMVLQLLVENAVKHGFEHLRDGGVLDINAQVEAERLIVCVKNPINLKHKQTSVGTGTGVKNIRTRLHLLYGSAATLTLNVEDNTHTATLIVPK